MNEYISRTLRYDVNDRRTKVCDIERDIFDVVIYTSIQSIYPWKFPRNYHVFDVSRRKKQYKYTHQARLDLYGIYIELSSINQLHIQSRDARIFGKIDRNFSRANYLYEFFLFFLLRKIKKKGGGRKRGKINKFDAYRYGVATVNIGEVRSYISGKEKFLLLEENFFFFFFRQAQFICRAENCRTFVTLKNRARTLEYIEIFLSSSSRSPANV